MAKRRKRSIKGGRKTLRREDLRKRELQKLEERYAQMKRNDILKTIAIVMIVLVAAYGVNMQGGENDSNSSTPPQLQFALEVPSQTTVQSQTQLPLTSIKAPEFSAVDVTTGEPISLSQYKGTVILLNFVNYGCDPTTNQVVSAQLLAIRDLREQRDDFMPLSIFCGCCPEDVLRDFAQQNNLSWPWVLDSDYSVIGLYLDYVKIYGYPTLVFIDSDQHITDVTGYCDISTLSTKIDEALQ